MIPSQTNPLIKLSDGFSPGNRVTHGIAPKLGQCLRVGCIDLGDRAPLPDAEAQFTEATSYGQGFINSMA